MLGLAVLVCLLGVINGVASAVDNPQNSAVGLQGKISSPAPTTAPTVGVPKDGQTFTSIPITVSGLCTNDLLIKIFKNNVFAGATQCKNGSYSLQIDLFIGLNQIIARAYDALDQASPDSAPINVTFSSNVPGIGPRVSLTTVYAKRGVDPGKTLAWPIILSGGQGPYAVSIDWGDGKPTDLKSLQFAGTFEIDHVYDSPGIYNITINASDNTGASAFLQVVGLANGAATQANSSGQNSQNPIIKTQTLWQPVALAVPLLIFNFWLGKRYERQAIRRKIERGQQPF